MLMSCRRLLAPHTRQWSYATRAKAYQYEANDFDVIANVPQREYIFLKKCIPFGKRLQSKCIQCSPDRLLSVKYSSFVFKIGSNCK